MFRLCLGSLIASAALIALLAGTRAAVAQGSTAAQESIEELLLEVSVNGEAPDTVLVLRRKNGGLFVRVADLRRWRLVLPEARLLRHAGEDYYPLDALPGLALRIDDAKQALSIAAPPALMTPTLLSAQEQRLAAPPPAPPGAFANYEIVVDRTQGFTHGSGVFELGAFAGSGVGVASVVVHDVNQQRRVIRLDTTLTHDRPAELRSLRLGDGIARAGSWGRSVHFGGVQLATNFATQPGLVTIPMLALSGEAVVPSTVDVYVNNALGLRRQAPVGPFSIQDIPIVTGRGEVRLVVRDLLGREQAVVLPYYASPQVLRQGLHDYSYETGFVRQNFGIVSNDYGRGFVAGTHRLGVTDSFTAEVRGEALSGEGTLGLGGAFLWQDFGVFNAAVARSTSDRGAGSMGQVGVEHQTRGFSFGGNTQVASEHFRQLGLEPDELAPRQLAQLFAGLAIEGNGSISVSGTRQDFRDRQDVRLVNTSYNTNLGSLAAVTVSVLRVYAARTDTSVSFILTLPLGERTVASASGTARQGNKPQSVVQVQQSLPAGTGYGYRLLASLADDQRHEGSLALQNDFGTYTVEVAETRGVSAARASVAGGFSYLGGGGIFASRRITDSFGVVQVAGYPGVQVYADNQPVARTGADGNALVPRLRPYERNRISIEQADLPLDSQVGAVEQEAVPYFRSGVVVPFAVKSSRGALLTVFLDDGEPIPAGALARLVGETQEFPVGMRGELYLTGLVARSRVRVSWRGQSCVFSVYFEPGGDPLPDLGGYACLGVKR